MNRPLLKGGTFVLALTTLLISTACNNGAKPAAEGKKEVAIPVVPAELSNKPDVAENTELKPSIEKRDVHYNLHLSFGLQVKLRNNGQNPSMIRAQLVTLSDLNKGLTWDVVEFSVAPAGDMKAEAKPFLTIPAIMHTEKKDAQGNVISKEIGYNLHGTFKNEFQEKDITNDFGSFSASEKVLDLCSGENDLSCRVAAKQDGGFKVFAFGAVNP